MTHASPTTLVAGVCPPFYLLILDGERDAHDLAVRRGHRYKPPAELAARDDVVRNAVKHLLGQEAVMIYGVGGRGMVDP